MEPSGSCSAVKIVADSISLRDNVALVTGLDSLEIVGKLEVSTHLLSRYGDRLGSLATQGREREAIYLQQKLTGILSWFRKRGKPTYAVYGRRFNTAVLNKGRDHEAAAVVAFLKDEGILYEKDNMVFLNQDRLAQYDVFYVKQNELGFEKRFERLLDAWREYSTAE